MSEEVNSRGLEFGELLRSLAMEEAFYRQRQGSPVLLKQDMGSVNVLSIAVNDDNIQLNDNAVPDYRALYTFICVFDRVSQENFKKLKAQQEKSLNLGLMVDFVLVDLAEATYENLAGGKITDKKLKKALEEALSLEGENPDNIREIQEKAYESARRGEKIMTTSRKLSLSGSVMILVILNVAVFFVGMILSKNTGNDPFIEWGILHGEKVRQGEWWRLFTAMFLHADLTHLFGNMYLLTMLGRALSGKYSGKKLTFVYLLSGAFGCLLSTTFVGGLSLGASGAIMGLGGVILCKLLFDKDRRYYRQGNLYAHLAVMVIFNLAYGLFNTGIDNFGHFGGFILGFLLELLFQNIKSNE